MLLAGPQINLAMNTADFGALRCQAAYSAGIYIFCPSNGKGAIVFERIKLGANCTHSLKCPAIVHANALWSRVAIAIQQKRRGYDQDVVLLKAFYKKKKISKNTMPMPRIWSSRSSGLFPAMAGRNWTTEGLRESNCVRQHHWVSKEFKNTLTLFSFPSVSTNPLFFSKVTQFLSTLTLLSG